MPSATRSFSSKNSLKTVLKAWVWRWKNSSQSNPLTSLNNPLQMKHLTLTHGVFSLMVYLSPWCYNFIPPYSICSQSARAKPDSTEWHWLLSSSTVITRPLGLTFFSLNDPICWTFPPPNYIVALISISQLHVGLPRGRMQKMLLLLESLMTSISSNFIQGSQARARPSFVGKESSLSSFLNLASPCLMRNVFWDPREALTLHLGTYEHYIRIIYSILEIPGKESGNHYPYSSYT